MPLQSEIFISQPVISMYNIKMKLLRNPMSHYVLLTGLYFVLTFILPANKTVMAQYHLSASQYHILLFVIVLPAIGTWFAAFYGYTKLQTYARTIRNTHEGDDYTQLATGCGWLAYALPISALTSIILNSIANSFTEFHPTAIIITNYENLLLPLVAFSLLSSSARSLTAKAKLRFTISQARSIIITFVLGGVIYCYYIFRQFDLTSIYSSNNAFYLPVWLALITVIVPYLYTWFIGLLAAYEISIFAQQAKGVLYRQPLRYLGLGIAAVIISSIALQYATSIVPRTGSLSLNTTLAVVYATGLISAVGYILIALGATRLKRIEDV